METDPVSKTLCLEKLMMMDNVQNNYHVYDNIPSSETISLSVKIILILYFIMKLTMFQTTDNFSHVISGGRDRKIFMTDLRIPERRVLICEESAPILKMVMAPDQGSLWVATSESCIKNWVSYKHYVIK
jgi:hypothetical protein